MLIDPVDITQKLVRIPSVTPDKGECISAVSHILSSFGFHCKRIDRGGVANLYAKYTNGSGSCLCFAGHTDVVPVADESTWTYPPYSGIIHDGWLWGRGSVDMKSGLAAFISATHDFISSTSNFDGSIAMMITGDEEGPSIDGTVAILDDIKKNNDQINCCIVAEPTSSQVSGDTLKIGRRGSITFHVSVTGTAGHVAYPQAAKNPVTALIKMLNYIVNCHIDNGHKGFDPSTMSITTFDVNNHTTNVIPDVASATFNIRFNQMHTGRSLDHWVRNTLRNMANNMLVSVDITTIESGTSFTGADPQLVSLVKDSILDLPDRSEADVVLSTSGGTSDARFIKSICPVIECGLPSRYIHATDERCRTNDVYDLHNIYKKVLLRYFA